MKEKQRHFACCLLGLQRFLRLLSKKARLCRNACTIAPSINPTSPGGGPPNDLRGIGIGDSNNKIRRMISPQAYRETIRNEKKANEETQVKRRGSVRPRKYIVANETGTIIVNSSPTLPIRKQQKKRIVSSIPASLIRNQNWRRRRPPPKHQQPQDFSSHYAFRPVQR